MAERLIPAGLAAELDVLQARLQDETGIDTRRISPSEVNELAVCLKSGGIVFFPADIPGVDFQEPDAVAEIGITAVGLGRVAEGNNLPVAIYTRDTQVALAMASSIRKYLPAAPITRALEQVNEAEVTGFIYQHGSERKLNIAVGSFAQVRILDEQSVNKQGQPDVSEYGPAGFRALVFSRKEGEKDRYQSHRFSNGIFTS